MARNLFTYALMGGLAEGTEAYARGLGEEQRAQREFAARRALQDDQQAAMMERRGFGTGGGGTTGARAPAHVMTAEDAVANVNTIMRAPTEDEIRAMDPNAPEVMAPGYSAPTEVLDPRDAAAQAGMVYGPDGQRLAEGQKPRMMLDPEFFRKKSEEVIRYRKLMFAGPNADDLAKGEQTMVETNLLEGSAKGDRKATEALLVSKGKDPMETTARAEERRAEADKDRRTDPNARRTGGGGGAAKPTGPKPVTGVDLERAARAAEKVLANELRVPINRVNEELLRLERGKKLTPAQQQAADSWRAALQEVQKLSRSPGASAPASAQSDAPKRRVYDPATGTFK